MTFPSFRLRRRPCASADRVPGRTGKETLHFPLPVPARLAIIAAEFHTGGNMKCFDAGDIDGICEYAPDALALPLTEALSLASRKLRGLIELPSLKMAIVVFSSLDPDDAGPLADHHRDLLWKAFGLPVFEQLRGRDGRVVARECEVHDGLHFDERGLTTAFGAAELCSPEISREPCDCGVETPRLRNLHPLRLSAPTAKARAAAA